MSRRAVSILSAAILIFLALLALDAYPGLRGGSGWDWPYQTPDDWGAVGLLAALLLIYGVGAWLIRGRTRAALTWAVIGGTVLAFGVVNLSPRGDAFFHLFTRTVSPVQTGASALAVRIMAAEGVGQTLNRWPSVMRESLDANLIHFTTSPPGQPLIHYGLAQVFDSPALTAAIQPASLTLRAMQCSDAQVMRYTRGEIISAGLIAYLMPLLAALTAVPLYLAARDLTANPRAARFIALWWPLVPSVLMFAPTWNTFYPLTVTFAFYGLLRGLMRREMAWVFAGGVALSFTTFLNFSVLPALLLFGLFTLAYWWMDARKSATHPRGFMWTVRVGLVFGAGLLTVWAGYALVTGQTPLDLWRVTLEKHRLLVQRDYWAWLILHPYDVLLFTGWAAAALAIVGAWTAFKRAVRGSADAFDGFALAMLLTVLAVDIAGIVQGENARILIFYAPFLLLMGTRALAGEAPQAQDGSGDKVPHPATSSPSPLEGMPRDYPVGEGLGVRGFALFTLQALTVLVMAAVLPVVALDLNPTPLAPREDIGGLGDESALPFNESGARFGGTDYAGAFTLARYRHIADPAQQAITYEFVWAGESPTERPYYFELIAEADDPELGRVVSEPLMWTPQGGGYLTTCWRAGDMIRDVVVLRVPPVSAPVVWSVTLRAVDERTGDIAGENALAAVKYP